MSSTQVALAARRGLEAVRASLLESDGTPRYGVTDGSAFSMCPQRITSSTETDAGTTETIRCGGGSVFATVSTDDTITALNMTLELTAADIELSILMAQAIPYYNDADTVIIGLEDPGNITRPKIEFHAWQEARSSSSQAASPYGYFHWLFPSTTWRLDPVSLEEGFDTLVLVGKSEANASLYPGVWSDIPDEYQGVGLQAWWRANDVPDPDAAAYDNGNVDGGFIDSPASGS